VSFVGIDLSDEMLARAREAVSAQDLRNVTFRRGDITRLEGIADRSVDAVYSTMVLHHLETTAHLDQVFTEVRRVLKPDGGIYLVDFGHLKTEKTIRYFAHQYADRQPPLFTVDYLNSLNAAFEVTDWKAALARHLADRAKLYSTFLVPYMVAVKSAPRRELPGALCKRLRALRNRLPAHHQTDFNDLRTFFRLGGLRLAAFVYSDGT
jgi:SAM-dependent methyltransferase